MNSRKIKNLSSLFLFASHSLLKTIVFRIYYFKYCQFWQLDRQNKSRVEKFQHGLSTATLRLMSTRHNGEKRFNFRSIAPPPSWLRIPTLSSNQLSSVKNPFVFIYNENSFLFCRKSEFFVGSLSWQKLLCLWRYKLILRDLLTLDFYWKLAWMALLWILPCSLRSTLIQLTFDSRISLQTRLIHHSQPV